MKRMITNTQRLVIAGNSLSSTTQSKDMHKQAKYLIKNFVAGSVGAIKQLDDFLLQLTNKLDVDLMPGEFDPTNMMLPQQPLHHAMFTKTSSANRSRLHSVTNPYRFEVNNVSFLGISGQLIDNIRCVTSLDDPVDLMKLTMEAGHIAPTCPDTLACYPFYGNDPFILNELPHVYFAGNQEVFKHEKFFDRNRNCVHLISLPKFSSTFSCVLFNIRTFESEIINF